MTRRRKTGRLYVIARNAAGRPTLQHLLLEGAASITACGQTVTLWSRAYQIDPIPEVLCLKRGCRG